MLTRHWIFVDALGRLAAEVKGPGWAKRAPKKRRLWISFGSTDRPLKITFYREDVGVYVRRTMHYI